MNDRLNHLYRVRRTLAFLAAAVMAACGEAKGVHLPSDAGTNDGGDASCIPQKQPTECPIAGPLEFGWNSVVEDPDVIDRRTNCLDQGTYHHTTWKKRDANDRLVINYCEQSPACNSCTALAGVFEAMADPEITAALDQAPPGVFGRDLRGMSGAMYSVRIGAACFKEYGKGERGFDLGVACQPEMSDCYPIPEAIANFVEQLRALEREQRSQGNCRGIR